MAKPTGGRRRTAGGAAPTLRRTRSAKSAPKSAPKSSPRITIVGFGRLGGALALGLIRRGYDVHALPHSGASVRRAAQLRVPLADGAAISRSDLCFLAVPDAAVADVARDLSADLGARTALVHCAGALGLDAFRPALAQRDRPVGSFHPLCAVSAPTDPLEGHAVAVSSRSPALVKRLEQLARALGLFAIQVPEAHRAAYHAAAVLSAGHAVSLLGAAAEAFGLAGLPEEDAVRALLPLMRSALRGVEQRGLTRGLTGPIPRGDAAVVRLHLAALGPELAPLYRLLSERALARLRPTLPKPVQRALDEALRPSRPPGRPIRRG